MTPLAPAGAFFLDSHRGQYWDLRNYIYINDLFFSTPDFEVTKYTDENSPCEYSGSAADVIRKLEEDALYLLKWYETNYLVPNPDKWHLLLSDTGELIDLHWK